eukprot:1161365-Pelagomonas_calceolata.AAC.2
MGVLPDTVGQLTNTYTLRHANDTADNRSGQRHTFWAARQQKNVMCRQCWLVYDYLPVGWHANDAADNRSSLRHTL